MWGLSKKMVSGNQEVGYHQTPNLWAPWSSTSLPLDCEKTNFCCLQATWSPAFCWSRPNRLRQRQTLFQSCPLTALWSWNSIFTIAGKGIDQIPDSGPKRETEVKGTESHRMGPVLLKWNKKVYNSTGVGGLIPLLKTISTESNLSVN